MKLSKTKSNGKIAAAMLAGIILGAGAATAIRAQQAKTPRAYVIAEEAVTDAAAFQTYAEKVPATLAPFGGSYLVRGGKVLGVEGEAPKRFVVIAFDSLEKAQSWWNSPAYDALKPIRRKASSGRVFIAEGVAP